DPPARGARGSGPQRRADRRARRAAQHDSRGALQNAARRPPQAPRGARPAGIHDRVDLAEMTMHSSRDNETLRRLIGPAEPELLCEECFERLDEYVDAELAGARVDERIRGMRAHLEGCPACHEDYE